MGRGLPLVHAIAIWCGCGVAVLALALYRKILTFHGDDEFVHLSCWRTRLIPRRLPAPLGKDLTIFTVASGLLIVAVFLLAAWQASLQIK
jgi:hypothetical protein